MCITISIVGNKHGVYIDSRNCNAYLDITRAENYDCIDFTGVNNVVVYRYDDGKFYISSTGGYTEERGLFCDLYEEEGKIMTLYRVYYRSKSGKTGLFDSGVWYVEIPDSYGRKKAAMAREEFYKEHGTEFYEVYRVVRDC